MRYRSAFLALTLVIACHALTACERTDQEAAGEAETPPAVVDTVVVTEPAEAAAEAVEPPRAESEAMEAKTGIEGLVTIGPVCPAPEAGKECPDRPYSATIVVREAGSDRVVATFTSGEDGRFRVELPPGNYVLDPGEPQLIAEPVAEAVEVVVEEGVFAYAVVRFDSGVR
jgi:hypothetical protein